MCMADKEKKCNVCGIKPEEIDDFFYQWGVCSNCSESLEDDERAPHKPAKRDTGKVKV